MIVISSYTESDTVGYKISFLCNGINEKEIIDERRDDNGRNFARAYGYREN